MQYLTQANLFHMAVGSSERLNRFPEVTQLESGRAPLDPGLSDRSSSWLERHGTRFLGWLQGWGPGVGLLRVLPVGSEVLGKMPCKHLKGGQRDNGVCGPEFKHILGMGPHGLIIAQIYCGPT